jgi:broad specificity phosphatase PhoE
MRKVILVRHSAPEIEPSVPAREWHLSAAGRQRCRGLATALRSHDPTRIITSTEAKAIETGELVAQALGLPWLTAEDLHEHDRSNVGFLSSEGFAASVARFYEQPTQLVFGSETAEQAYQRFAGGVADVIQQYPEDTLAIVAHGTVISLFVARATGVEPLPFWKRLGLPSFVVLSLPGPRVQAVVEMVGV